MAKLKRLRALAELAQLKRAFEEQRLSGLAANRRQMRNAAEQAQRVKGQELRSLRDPSAGPFDPTPWLSIERQAAKTRAANAARNEVNYLEQRSKTAKATAVADVAKSLSEEEAARQRRQRRVRQLD